MITRLNIGGPARQVCHLQEVFNGHQNESVLVYGQLDKGEGDFSSLLKNHEKAIHLRHLRRPLCPWSDALAVFKILKILGQNDFDLIHTHTAKAGWVGRMAGWLHNKKAIFSRAKKVKMVHTYHGHVFSGYFSKPKEVLIKTAERFLWKRTDALLTLTEKLKDEITGHLCVRSGKVHVVPLGLDLEPCLDVKKTNYFSRHFGIREDAVWVGWVGRLVEIKNPERFLEIAAKLQSRTETPLYFVLVGDGHLRENVMQKIENTGMKERVHLYGWTDDLTQVYGGLDFFFNTSDNEGTPVAALEAMASGVPVALSDVGGSAEVLPPHPDVTIYSVDDLDSKLDKWLEVILKKNRLPDELRRKIVDDYSRDSLVKNLENIYSKLDSDSPSP